MNREEKRRKFNEAVVKMLYPPPPEPPLKREDEDRSARSFIDVGYDSDDLGVSSCSTSDENGEGEVEGRLSRAQRKKIRRKKLKEEASRRGNVIGPLLPPPPMGGSGEGNGGVGGCIQGVQSNATEKPDASSAAGKKEGEFPSQSNKKKLKHRRMAKRLAKDQLKPSSTQCCNQDPSSCGDNRIQESRPLKEGHADDD